jgi:A/G-specific adenine glycosylase
LSARTRPNARDFAAALIDWHARHGRHDLPWQRRRTAYRVWVSEIMLQQTQVATVIPYYERFMRRFPDLATLAAATLDEVLHLWSGLGYYARARNLHRAAIRIVAEHGGRFPRRFEAVADLPGIGRSTAGAILALSRAARFPILDGNVRRVLSRHFGIAAPASHGATLQTLWRLSEECTPTERVDIYTQAVMDLGATVCVRRNPACGDCPVSPTCLARASGRQQELPSPRRSRARRRRQVFMLAAVRADGDVLLERRPERGVWGGLWCLPEFASAAQAAYYAQRMLQGAPARPLPLRPVEHAFTHFDLLIRPLLAQCSGRADSAGERPRRKRATSPPPTVWYRAREPVKLGLPAPIRSLLARLAAGGQAQLFY